MANSKGTYLAFDIAFKDIQDVGLAILHTIPQPAYVGELWFAPEFPIGRNPTGRDLDLAMYDDPHINRYTADRIRSVLRHLMNTDIERVILQPPAWLLAESSDIIIRVNALRETNLVEEIIAAGHQLYNFSFGFDTQRIARRVYTNSVSLPEEGTMALELDLSNRARSQRIIDWYKNLQKRFEKK